MRKYDERVIKEVKDGFQRNKGKGSIFLPQPVNIYPLIFSVIVTIRNKTPDCKILITTDTFQQRNNVIESFNVIEDEAVRKYYIDKLTVLTKDFTKSQYYKDNEYHLAIILGLNHINDINKIIDIERASKFTLCILTENIMDTQFTTKLREILPDIVTNISVVEARKAIVYSPVEEIRCPIYLSDKDSAKYEEYSNYIKDSMSIFGDIQTVNKCREGDIANKISAMDVRLQLAKANGWSYDLDTTVEFMKNIDDLYNPNAILERAEVIYNTIRSRRDLLLNNDAKLEEIKNILENEIDVDQNVIIVSKTGEFARRITEYLNSYFGDSYCADYHNCIPEGYVTDENGEIIKYKTGKQKGQPRIYKAQAISTLNLKYFNDGYIKVLSIKNSSSASLKTASSTVILTSSLTDDIIKLRNRFVDIDFGERTRVYRLYCKNTIEETELLNEMPNSMVTIKEKEKEVSFDETSGEIII